MPKAIPPTPRTHFVSPMARTAATLVVLAAAVLTAVAPAFAAVSLVSGYASVSPNRLARGVTKRMKSTGGTVLYQADSGTLSGGNEAASPGNKYLQFGIFTGLNTSVVD